MFIDVYSPRELLEKNHSSALINFPPLHHVNDEAEAISLFSHD